MTRKRKLLLASAMLASVTGAAVAQVTGGFDPAQLPETTGKVAQYSLSPRGDVDGLILTDGTEVHLPPHLGTQLVFAVKPGDTVSIRGLKARALPLVQAMSVTNEATKVAVVDEGPGAPPGPFGSSQALTVHGRVKQDLHGPAGDLNGALLDDGTIVRMPPPEAQRLAALIAPGAPIDARGTGYDGRLGRVLAVNMIGPDAARMVQVASPPPGRRGPPPPPPDGGPGAPPPPPAL